MGASSPPFSSGSRFKQSGATMRLSVADASRINQRQKIVATKGYSCVGTGGGSGEGNPTNMDCRLNVRIGPSNVSNIRLLFSNFYASGFDSDGPSSITVSAAIEIGNGSNLKAFPVTFRGSLTATIAPKGASILSDPIGITLPANTLITVRTNVAMASGDTVVTGYLVHGGATLPQDTTANTSENCVRNTTASVVYNTGAISGTPVEGYCPLAIIGDAEKPMPSFVLIGDSIMRGSGENVASNLARGQGIGYVARGLRLTNDVMLPFCNIGKDGLALNVYTSGYYGLEIQRRMAVLEYATHAIFHIGTNDLTTTGLVLSDVQASYLTMWKLAKQRGLRVYQCTILPRTNSGNTAVINTQFASGGLRDQLNAWFQTQVGGAIDGVIDANPALEDQANKGFWVSGVTADGVHPNTTGYQAGAAVVRAWAESLIAA